MSRRYGEAVQIRPVAGIGDEQVVVHDEPGPAPDRFLWRNRLYVVRSVLAHWVEVGPWWQEPRDWGEAHERQVWRVEAAAGRSAEPGIYDLCRDGAGRWSLVRTYD